MKWSKTFMEMWTTTPSSSALQTMMRVHFRKKMIL